MPSTDAIQRAVALAESLRHLMNAQQLAALAELKSIANLQRMPGGDMSLSVDRVMRLEREGANLRAQVARLNDEITHLESSR